MVIASLYLEDNAGIVLEGVGFLILQFSFFDGWKMNESKRMATINSGFTLVEIIVVLAVIILVSLISMPGLKKWLPDMRLRDASRDLYGYIQKGRLGAAKTNNDWAISFDTANDRFTLYSDWGATNKVESTVQLSGYGSGVSIGRGGADTPAGTGFDNDDVTYNIPGNPNTVVFSPLGTANQGYVYLENVNKTTCYAVGTYYTGAVTIKRWTGTKWLQ